MTRLELALPAPESTSRERSLLRIYWLETKYEFLKLWRVPAFTLPAIGFPVLFYILFGLTLKLAAELDPDVVLTDIEMPRMTGLELVAAMRERKIRSRVIIVTTFARPGYLRRAVEVGASGYLLKDSPAQEKGWL